MSQPDSEKIRFETFIIIHAALMKGMHQESFDNIYRNQYDKRSGFLWGMRPSEAVVSLGALLKEDYPEGARILDIGCGEGRNAISLAGQGHRVYGIDISPLAIEKAESWAKQMKLTERLFLIVGNVEKGLPFPSGYFHAATDIFAMTFVRESAQQRYVGEIARVLNEGGYFLLEFQKHSKRQTKEELQEALEMCERSDLHILRHHFFIKDWRQFRGGRHLALRLLGRKSDAPDLISPTNREAHGNG